MFKKLIRRFLPGGGTKLTLQPGDSAPAWECADQNGTRYSSKELLGNRYLLWFYPMADTPG